MSKKNETSLVKRIMQYSYGLLMATIAYMSLSWFQAVPGGIYQEMQRGADASIMVSSSEHKQ